MFVRCVYVSFCWPFNLLKIQEVVGDINRICCITGGNEEQREFANRKRVKVWGETPRKHSDLAFCQRNFFLPLVCLAFQASPSRCFHSSPLFADHRPRVAPGIFRRGLTLPVRGLKYGFHDTINAKNLVKRRFSPSDGG